MSLNLSGYYTFIVQDPEFYKKIASLIDKISVKLSCFQYVGDNLHLSFVDIEPSISKLEKEKYLKEQEFSEEDLDEHEFKIIENSIKDINDLISLLQDLSNEFIDKDNVYTKIDGRVRFQFCEIIIKNELTY